MAKRKNMRRIETSPVKKAKKEPKFTHIGFKISVGAIILGFVAQLVMAAIVYPHLPSKIPAGWVGSSVPYNQVPSWIVFIAFPGAQVAMLLLCLFAPRDRQGRRLMENGNAIFLVLLSLLFTSLQFSAFRIGHGSLY